MSYASEAAEPPGFDMKAGARMGLCVRDVLLPWLACLAAVSGCLEVSAWLLDSVVGPVADDDPGQQTVCRLLLGLWGRAWLENKHVIRSATQCVSKGEQGLAEIGQRPEKVSELP